ncbi:MAG: winged-helix domain-containing protein, partial [Nitrososphaeria archaeon]
ISENERKQLDFIRARGTVTRRDCELLLNLSERSIRRLLGKLEKLGFIKKVGRGKQIKYMIASL